TLVGLMLPAVQRVRESAAQTSCRNNLKQIGIALHGYHSDVGHLPPGYLCDTLGMTEIEFTDPGWGWAAYLLPYLEQTALANKLQWDAAVEDDANAEARLEVVRSYVCPSDLNRGQFAVWTLYNVKISAAATNSYAACYGFGGAIGEYAGDGNGIFYRNSRTRFSDIKDGTAYTLAVGERAAWFCQTPWIGAITNGTVRTNPNSPNLIIGMEGAPVMVMARTSGEPLNNPYSTPYDFYTPHPAAGQFLFADGSVRALPFSLPSYLWQAFGTRAGGEVVPPN